MEEKKGCAIGLTAGIVFVFVLLLLLYFGGMGIALAVLLPRWGILVGGLLLGVGLLAIAILVYVGVHRVKEIEEENKDDYRNY